MSLSNTSSLFNQDSGSLSSLSGEILFWLDLSILDETDPRTTAHCVLHRDRLRCKTHHSTSRSNLLNKRTMEELSALHFRLNVSENIHLSDMTAVCQHRERMNNKSIRPIHSRSAEHYVKIICFMISVEWLSAVYIYSQHLLCLPERCSNPDVYYIWKWFMLSIYTMRKTPCYI